MSAANQDTDQINSKISAEQLLLRLLELIKSSETIQDFTPERMGEAMKVKAQTFGPGHFGYGVALTRDWSYALEVNEKGISGSRLDLEFIDRKSTKDSPATDICKIDFNRFASALETAGFKQQPLYGEHGEIVFHRFDRPGLSITVATRGEADEPIEKISHACVRLVTVQ